MHLDCIRSDYVVEPCQGGIDVGNSTYHTVFSQCWSFNWFGAEQLQGIKNVSTKRCECVLVEFSGCAAADMGRADAIRNFIQRIPPRNSPL